jgi:hypothetical protein
MSYKEATYVAFFFNFRAEIYNLLLKYTQANSINITFHVYG